MQEKSIKMIKDIHNTLSENIGNDISRQMPLGIFQVIGMGYTARLVYLYMNEILVGLYLMLLISAVGGIGYGANLAVWWMYQNVPNLQDDVSEEMNDFFRFVENDYDTIMDIYSNGKMKEYETTDSKVLMNTENHYKSSLPFEYNTEIIMMYSKEDEAFHYFTKNSNIQYNILNSVCRSYVVEHRCLHLFQDEADLARFASVFDDSEQEEEEKNKKNEETEETEETEESGKPEDIEDETKSARSFSLFYMKKTKKTEIKKEPMQEKKINKFIYKGNFQEYEYLFNKEKNEKTQAMKIDYKTYKDQESFI
jgi:hypothetical protein